jgi:nitroreductase
MTTVQDINNALNFRYAVKTFKKGEKVEVEKLEAIIEAGRMAPAAYGLQPYKLVHVADESMRENLKAAAYEQTKVTDAGDFFVMAVRTDIDENFVNEYVKNISETRGVSEESLKGFSDNMKGDIITRDENNKFAWAGRQAYISLGFMLETAAILGVDMCPMEGFDAGKFDEILNLKNENLKSVGAFAVGKRDETDIYATLKKVRISKENFILQK